jgi:hypothetical protein
MATLPLSMPDKDIHSCAFTQHFCVFGHADLHICFGSEMPHKLSILTPECCSRICGPDDLPGSCGAMQREPCASAVMIHGLAGDSCWCDGEFG